MEITKEKTTPLLGRKRIYIKVENDKTTPSRADLRQKVITKFKYPEERTIIKHIFPKYGTTEVKLIVNIYDSIEIMNKLEDKKLLAKNFPKTNKEEATE